MTLTGRITPVVPLYPTGGDDGAALSALLPARDGAGLAIELQPQQTYNFSTTPVLPRGLTTPLFILGNGAIVKLSTAAKRALDMRATVGAGTTASGSPVVTGVSTTRGNFRQGATVQGTGITNGTTIASVDSATQLTLSANATANGSTTINQYDTYQKIEIWDLIVDANNVASATNQGVLLSNLIDGAWDPYLSFQDIAARRCRTINVPAANTDGNTTGSRQSISIISRHLTAGEATQTFVKNILDEDCVFAGGGGVTAGGYEPTNTGANVFCDNLRSVRLRHDSGVTPSAPPGNVTAFSVQHGLIGRGGSSSIVGLRSNNCFDAAMEQDSMQTAYNEDCIVTDAWNVAFLPRNFATPTDLSQQTYTYKNCWNVVKNINPPSTSTFLGNAYGWFLSGSGAPTFGHVILEDCGNLCKSTNMRVNGEAIACAELPIRKLTLRNFKAIHETINDSPGSAPNWSLIRWGPSLASELEVKGLHCSIAGTYGGPAGTFRTITFEGAGPYTISMDDPVYESTLTATGSTLYCEWYGKNAGAANAVITSGTIRRRKARNFTTSPTVNVRGFVGSPALTITNEIVDENCDHSGFPAADSDVLFGGSNDARPQVKSRGGTAIKSTAVASAATITLPDKGDFIAVSGTTNITSVTASWNGRVVTLKFAGILTFTDGSNLALAGNFVTTADDTITLVCDGTNWYEVARSVN